MLFSAIICATDSVAALTLIPSDTYPKLFSVVFGEGMINDAVSIILYKSVDELVASNSDFSMVYSITRDCLVHQKLSVELSYWTLFWIFRHLVL